MEALQIILEVKSFLKQKRKNKNFTYQYFNFWKISDPTKVWFSKFIEYRGLNPNQKHINFVSVFGSPYSHIFLKSPKVFYTGEDLQSSTFPKLKKFKNNLIGKVDLSLGFEEVEHNNYFRLPLWVISFFEPDEDFESLQERINDINNVRHRLYNHSGYISQISRHDVNGVRKELIDLLSDMGQIDCAGAFMNNTTELKSTFKDNKIDFLSNYKFNICPENSDSPGYVTEKLIDAFKAGSIPIYWSEKNIPDSDVINKDAILFYDKTNPELLKKRVEELLTNNESYHRFLTIPPFKPDAAERIWEMFNELAGKFSDVINKY